MLTLRRAFAIVTLIGAATLGGSAQTAVRGRVVADDVDKRTVTALYAEIEDPEFLESLVAGATRVALSEGQRVSLALRAPPR